MFGELADDVAHDNTYWRCPVTHELLPVVPGSRRLEWMREREAFHARLCGAPSMVVEVSAPLSELLSDLLSSSEPTPEPTFESTFEALESDIEPTEPVAGAVVLPIVAQHNKRLSVNTFSVDWVTLGGFLWAWLVEYWRVPLALAVALLLILVSQ
jgi:hypothetical protein